MNPSLDRNESRRIGLFGGTFDPIHRGHVEVAEAVRRCFVLERICLIPAAQPPHKHARTPAADRLAMARLAVAARPGWEVSDLELQRRGPSYTIDTVNAFKQASPPGTRFYFLLGSDAFLEFNTWKAYNELLREIALIVLARGGDAGAPDSLAVRLERFVSRYCIAGYRWDGAAGAFIHPASQPIHLFDGPRLAISASQIRQRIAGGRSVRLLLDEAVADYIQSKGLYR